MKTLIPSTLLCLLLCAGTPAGAQSVASVSLDDFDGTRRYLSFRSKVISELEYRTAEGVQLSSTGDGLTIRYPKTDEGLKLRERDKAALVALLDE